MTGNLSKHARLFDDNPASIDLLGFDAVVAPVVEILQTKGLDPIAIGVHAAWGGGKSTVLELLDDRLNRHDRYIVVRVNPWEFEDSADVKGALIDAVLASLRTKLSEDQGAFNEALKGVAGLLRRVSWARAGQVLLRSAVTMTPDLGALADALTPTEEQPLTLAGFRGEFAGFLAQLAGIDRVVVLVDDLDRCLPPAVVQSLEAIKLFLSVEKIAFVIAADQDAVRAAISFHLSGGRDLENVARHYLDKIIQIPILLPRIPAHDAEAYVALLIAGHELGEPEMEALRVHCRARRAEGKTPLAGAVDLGLPTEAARLAAQVVHGLGPERAGNPRDIKRFLNLFGVRQSIATARSVGIDALVLVKLLLLEDRHRPAFAHLVSRVPAEQASLIEAWEAWGADDADKPPPHIDLAGTHDWARRDPSLVGVELASYLTLAASLAGATSVVSLPAELLEAVNDLCSSVTSVREAAQGRVGQIGGADRQRLTSEISERLRRSDEPAPFIRALVFLAGADPMLVPEAEEAVRRVPTRDLTPAAMVVLAQSGVEALVAHARSLHEDPDLSGPAKVALTDALGPS
ncbi:MAG: P-loop ATPase [Thermoleophilia bacterium]|nr:P-loop ATPase [Thermoleophilia bacterium]